MHRKFVYIILILLFKGIIANAQDGQISIPRVELMPNEPSPYLLRDWKQVAINYDRFVYDLNNTGQFLPLLQIKPEGNNYPQRNFFSIPSYVGSNNPSNGEAINILPSLVGASLVGVDKSNQNGNNYVLMAQDFFNKKNGENLYLNGNSTRSGNDWWYDMMPNVFFYQLYYLYPNMGGEAELQFLAIADRMLEAIQVMGGSNTPWNVPFMTYRAWKFATMEPLDEGVPEPESAGAFSWLLYHAYSQTGRVEYRIGAEWAMEYLNDLEENPSYELQLPYGSFIAAKMNAELGTNYDIEKMVNWSFDRGNLRGWGTIVDHWSGLDFSGLVGESESDTDYAFHLNGVQQAAALVPMVRYDKRFARAIAKWLLNLANANRFFFHSFLPSSLQDATEWSTQYDQNRVIAYEAIREVYNGLSPFATGDAVNGGWAETNLALYGSSSIGYLGGIITESNIDKILKIDLLKTDFFHNEAYPTYLYYNPYDTDKEILLFSGTEQYDIYDPLSETFLKEGVSGSIGLTVPADQAIMPVIIPSGGEISFDQNKMLINGIVIDFDQHIQEYSQLPRIKSLATEQEEIPIGEDFSVFSTVQFEGNRSDLDYSWYIDDNPLDERDSILVLSASELGEYELKLVISNMGFVSDSASIRIHVVPEIEKAPVITSLISSSAYGLPGETILLEANAEDENGDPLNFEWSVSAGTLEEMGNQASWILPGEEGIYTYELIVRDDTELSDSDSGRVLVKSFQASEGELIAYYPLEGSGEDESGNDLDGSIFGAVSTTGINDLANEAYYFNGTTHYMAVSNDPKLNFTDAATISLWMNPDNLPDRESFLISHGSWHNRWKISIIPEKNIRWTINTNNGIRDLDSEQILEEELFRHITACFDGSYMYLYMDGKLENFLEFEAEINTTSLPLLLAQALPGEPAYNFRGIIDEVKIFNFSLTPIQVKTLYETGELTSNIVNTDSNSKIEVFPNPVMQELNIKVDSPFNTKRIRLFDQSGKLVLDYKVMSNEFSLNLSELSDGIYYMHYLVQGNIRGIEKIIKNTINKY